MLSQNTLSGNLKTILVATIGLGLTLLLYLLNNKIPAGIVLIITGTLLLALIISADAKKNARPIILADLSPGHREVVLENVGTYAAEKLEILVSGVEEPWQIDRLEPDTMVKLSLPDMVRSVIVEVTYQFKDDMRRSKAFTLGRFEQDKEQDLFKPMFPLFGWKNK